MQQRVTGNQNVQISQVQNSIITVSVGSRGHRAVPLEPSWFELPRGVTSPARLLRARYGVVPYLPLGDLSQQLDAWSHFRRPFGLRVLAGAAGVGKTRVAIELCRSLSQLRWLTGLLKSTVDPEQLDLLAETPTPRLVVVDYAETRHEQLAELLPILARKATYEHPVRVLLTTRSRADAPEAVRRQLYGHGDALDVAIDRADVDLLADLPFGEHERRRLFDAAVKALSLRLRRDDKQARELMTVLPDPSLPTALMVLIAAYLAVEDGRVPASRMELLDGLLDHEDAYWSQAAARAGIDTDKTLRRRVVALATLASTGVDESETVAARLLRLVPDLHDASERDRRVLARWVHDLYQGTAWWNPVEPDLIGEHLVASTYSTQPKVLAGVLTDRPPDALIQPLRLLARAARDHAPLAGTLQGVVTERLADLCNAAIEQASGADAPRLLEAGTTVAGALEPLVTLAPPDPSRLPDVIDGFRRDNTVLAHLAVRLINQLADHYRGLAAANPAAVEPQLASALNKLGMRMWDLGRRERALEVTEEAVEIRRRLAAANPAAFEPDLASALNNLSVHLSNIGRFEQALGVNEEAVQIYRRLTVANPGAFEPSLASALNNLGVRLSKLGRRQHALRVTEEAVQIRRRLATANSASFEPDLAHALSNLGSRLSDVRRWAPALAAIEEAVQIYRRLADASPAAFEPYLARGLWTLAEVCLAAQIELHEALEAVLEASDIYRRLARQVPAAFAEDLRGAVATMADVLDGLSREDEAAELRRSIQHDG